MIQAKDYHVSEQIRTCHPVVLLPAPCFTTASCFSSTSCSCSSLLDSSLSLASLVSCYPQDCSQVPAQVIWLGSHSCLPDGSFSSHHHCLLSLLCSSQSHLNLLQAPQQHRAGDAPTALLAVSARRLHLISMCCWSLLPASSCRQRSSLGRFPVHLISKQTPILFHMLINQLPSCSQPLLLSSSLPRPFKTSRSYWHMFAGRIFKLQCEGSGTPFPARNKTLIMTSQKHKSVGLCNRSVMF